ncbi:MAG: hypothetical protein ACR2HD_10790 [Solirubrobacteraceae bacterium]|nr:MAG: hypothetical protein DLM63_11435 [Solirubrobacterales bacterium]
MTPSALWKRLQEARALVLACALVAAALAALWLAVAPPTPDLAAQVYRADLFSAHGFTAWENQWFGGHHVLGYSLLFPELAAWLGARVVGVLVAPVAAALFAWLLSEWDPRRARGPALWFAVGTAGELMIGRITFALGTAIGLAALVALQRRHAALAVALAALCAAASPVAGLFLALAGIALALSAATAPIPAISLAAAAVVVDVVMALAFPEGGAEPFGTTAAALVVAIAVGIVATADERHRALRYGALLYAAGTLAAYALPTAMGSNATRLAAIFAGPALLAAARPRLRGPAIALLAIPLALYEGWGPVREVKKGASDPSVHAAYYQPVAAFLATHNDRPARLEVPFTRAHWESVYLARRYPLARGWEGQLDVKYDDLFHHRTLSASAYRAWLDQLGVRWVAVPDVALDPSGKPEARLIASGLAYLALRQQKSHWSVYEVTHSQPLASGAGRIDSLNPTSFSITAYRPGTIRLKIRFTPYWAITRGNACIERTSDSFTEVAAKQAGQIHVAVRFALGRIGATSPRCGGT